MPWDFPSSGFIQEKASEGFLDSVSFALSESSFCLIGIKLCRRTKAGSGDLYFPGLPGSISFQIHLLKSPQCENPTPPAAKQGLYVSCDPSYVSGAMLGNKRNIGSYETLKRVWVFLSSAFLSRPHRYHVCEHAAVVTGNACMAEWAAESCVL